MDPTAKTVLDYLKEQNRPYSSTDIFNNLHKVIGKAALQRDLDSLVESGEVTEKAYGKQKIYYASQKNEVAPTDEDLAAIDREIESLKDEISERTRHLKELEGQLEKLTNSMSMADCRHKIMRYRNLNELLQTKVRHLEPREERKVDSAQRETLLKQKDFLTKELGKRKKICTDVLNVLLENYPGGKTDLLEEVGVELDVA